MEILEILILFLIIYFVGGMKSVLECLLTILVIIILEALFYLLEKAIKRIKKK